ncbi:class I SAM-dependent methyltransferase [Paenibacillus sp. CAU 1782]
MFPDLTKHRYYLRGQTMDWCNQLAARTGKYEYTWNYVYDGPSAENRLTERLASLIHGKVLDMGCGHGEYAAQWASLAEEIIGYDMTEGFIATANQNRSSNATFVVGYTHDGLPFPDDCFDIAYTKKGPTSWYKEGNRVVKPDGTLILFHPGDQSEEDATLASCFPGLFSPPSVGTPILDRIQERLEDSGLVVIEQSVWRESGWIPTPEDVFELVCFGQSDGFRQYVREQCFDEIVSQFQKHGNDKGIKTTGSYYFIQAKAT